MGNLKEKQGNAYDSEGNPNRDYGGNSMKCPFCHEEMEFGYVQSSNKIMWGKDKKSALFLPDEEKNEFYISKGILAGSFANAEYCSRCGKIIISLEKE